jgi:hypothetical protein
MHEVPAALQRSREITGAEKVTFDELYIVIVSIVIVSSVRPRPTRRRRAHERAHAVPRAQKFA